MERGFAVESFTIADYAEAYELWGRTPGMGLSAADGSERIENFLDRNPGLSFVVRQDAKLVGTLLCGSDGRRGYLYHLAVDPLVRRQGLGKALVAASLDALRAQGIDKCHLFLIADNKLGSAFWSAAGWTRRDDILIFSKSIQPDAVGR